MLLPLVKRGPAYDYANGWVAHLNLQRKLGAPSCADCGFETFDERGDAAHSTAVFEYLASQKK